MLNTRLLVVDDEDYILQSYAKILSAEENESATASTLAKRKGQLSETSASNYPNYTLFFAHSGEEAVQIQLEEAKLNNKFSVAFVDMKMPGGMDGLETIKQLREKDPDVLCAVVTAYTDRSVLQISSAFESADDWLYFNKPFNKGELQQLAFHMVSSYERRQKNRQASKMIQQIIKSYSANRKIIEKLWESLPTEEALGNILNWSNTLK